MTRIADIFSPIGYVMLIEELERIHVQKYPYEEPIHFGSILAFKEAVLKFSYKLETPLTIESAEEIAHYCFYMRKEGIKDIMDKRVWTQASSDTAERIQIIFSHLGDDLLSWAHTKKENEIMLVPKITTTS